MSLIESLEKLKQKGYLTPEGLKYLEELKTKDKPKEDKLDETSKQIDKEMKDLNEQIKKDSNPNLS